MKIDGAALPKVLMGLREFIANALIGVQYAKNSLRIAKLENIAFHPLSAIFIQYSAWVVSQGIYPARHAANAHPAGQSVQVPGGWIRCAPAQTAIGKKIFNHN